MNTFLNSLFPRILRQQRAQAVMYYLYTPAFGFGILRRSTSCIHAVVRTLLSRLHEKIQINKGIQL